MMASYEYLSFLIGIGILICIIVIVGFSVT